MYMFLINAFIIIKFTVAGNGKCTSWVDLCLPERVYWSLKLLEHDPIMELGLHRSHQVK